MQIETWNRQQLSGGGNFQTTATDIEPFLLKPALIATDKLWYYMQYFNYQTLINEDKKQSMSG